MLNWNVTRNVARRPLALTAAIAAVFGTGVALMGAQTISAQTISAQTPSSAAPATTLLAQPTIQAPALFSSSADENAPAPTLEASLLPANPFGSPMQYGGGQRGRYNRPRYRGSNTNADGSNKYIFYGGAGLQQPVGNTFHYYTPSWGIQVGGGRQFNKHLAVPIEFDYDHAGLTGQALGNQLALYNNDINYYCGLSLANSNYCSANGITDYASLDGNMHTWSFSVDPTENFYQGDKWGAYAVEGVGFYHKVTNFTTPAQGIGYDPFYGYYSYTANQTIDHYTSNAPGFSGGFGLTYKFSRFSNERFYAEARYVFVDNSHRAGVTVTSPVASTYLEANDFPANSNHTTYFPIKFGIRF